MTILRFIAAVILSALAVGLTASSASSTPPRETASYQHWISLWTKRDESIWPSIKVAATAFKVSESLMQTIVNGEGGNINPRTLKRSLCSGSQPGWNMGGSYAFGPMQYMLSSKPACAGSWGTFGAYDDRAFSAARRLGLNVPYRFKNPASNVGQAIVTAYIISIGEVCVHWSASLRSC